MPDAAGPAITVIVPVHNVEPYLDAALRSLEAQTFGDFEALLVENGSTDRSPDIARGWSARDARFQYREITDVGLSQARNQGLALARGEWIGLLDSDDCLPGHALERLYRVGREADADIVSALTLEVGEGQPFDLEKMDRRPLEALAVDRPLVYYLREHGFHPGMQWGPRAMACLAVSKLYRHRMVRDMRFIPSVYYEDVAFVPEAFGRAGRGVFLKDTLYCYLRRPGSITRTFNDRHMDSMVVVTRALAEVERSLNLDAEARVLLRTHIAQQVNNLPDWAMARAASPADSRRLLDRYAPAARDFERDYFSVRPYLSAKNRMSWRLWLDRGWPGAARAWARGATGLRRLARAVAGALAAPFGRGRRS